MTLTPDHGLRTFDAIESRLTAHVSERMLDLAEVGPGTRVLDLASGTGEPCVRAASRVGRAGRVVGVDLAGAALAIAREKAITAAVDEVLELRVLDAASVDTLGETFDVVTARWAIMSTADPVRVLAAARACLREGGRFVAAVWGAPAEIPWWSLPRQVTQRFAPLAPIDPRAPSAVRYGDVATLAADLARAGFALVHHESITTPVIAADHADTLVAWVRFVFRPWVDAVPPSARDAWAEALTRELEARRTGDELVLGGTTHVVVARALAT